MSFFRFSLLTLFVSMLAGGVLLGLNLHPVIKDSKGDAQCGYGWPVNQSRSWGDSRPIHRDPVMDVVILAADAAICLLFVVYVGIAAEAMIRWRRADRNRNTKQ
jgi:hypothetical protein